MKLTVAGLVLAGACGSPAETPPGRPRPATDHVVRRASGSLRCQAKDPAAVSTPRVPPTEKHVPYTYAGCPMIPTEVYGPPMFGAKADEVARAFKVREANMVGPSTYVPVSGTWRLSYATIRDAGDRVTAYQWQVFPENRPDIIAAWGEPAALADPKYVMWFNPDARVRVGLTEVTLASERMQDPVVLAMFAERYVPFASLFSDDGVFAQPLFGKTPAEIAAAYPALVPTLTAGHLSTSTSPPMIEKGHSMSAGMALQLPPLETNFVATLVTLSPLGGPIDTATLYVPTASEQQRAELVAMLGVTLGAPSSANGARVYAGPRATRVEVTDVPTGLRVTVRPR